MKPDEIRARLQRLEFKPKLDFRFEGLGPLADSAVLIALSEGESGLEVLLTKRSASLRKHAGQISFPGGRMDPEDPHLEATALRETYEELAIRPEDVQVYGSLLRVPTITGFHITAFVGEFPSPYDLVPDKREVEQLIIAPLLDLADPAIYACEQQEWGGKVFDMHSFDYKGHHIWGATGFMLYEFFKYLELK